MPSSSVSNTTAVASSSRPGYAAEFVSTVERCVWNIACHRSGAMIVASSAPARLGPALASKAYCPDSRRSCAHPLRAHSVNPTVRTEPVPARASKVLLQRRQLLAQRFDILLVKADTLPQFGEPVGVFLGILLLVGQRRWRAIAVGRACLDEKLFFGVELVGKNLAPQPIAATLRIRVYSGKSGRRRRAPCRAACLVAHPAGEFLPALLGRDIGV